MENIAEVVLSRICFQNSGKSWQIVRLCKSPSPLVFNINFEYCGDEMGSPMKSADDNVEK